MELSFLGERPEIAAIGKIFQDLPTGHVLVQPSGAKNMLMRFREVDEGVHQEIVSRVNKEFPGAREERFTAIGPTIGEELKKKTFIALVLVISAIVVYISWAFRKISKPVASWKYGVVAIVALLHDVTIPTGVYLALSRFLGYEVDVLFVTAILTALGFSVHDTIVVFDRIREKLRTMRGKTFPETVEQSVQETMARSIATSFTVFLVLLILFLFGGETTKTFALVMLLGVIFGTYSSIFIASPLLVSWEQWRLRSRS